MSRTKTALAIAVLLATVPIVRTAAAPADSDEAIVHVLNRIAFGARPGDVERVRRMGLAAYIDRQLHPERISDPAMPSRLAGLVTLGLSSREIAQRYEQPVLQARARAKREAANAPGGDGVDGTPPDTPTPALRRTDPSRQQANLPLADLGQQKILRAVYGERQLEEVLTDFWFNHFNVDARKGPVRFMLTEYERDVIRPHVLGRFRDLLGATAKSPAMLFYLDNWQSADPNGPHVDTTSRGRLRLMQRPNMPEGLNENYGRELLELHTLGVDGGYTQKDVTEVARSFTGWSIQQPRNGGGFRFVPMFHDDGEKVVLGHRIKSGGGIRDGEEVLDLLARHPSTARFIATKLARRFVSDTPPASLIDRAAARFRESNGDLRAVTTVILTSPEFVSPDAYRAKVKSPFEFTVSALRATGAEIADARPLLRSLQQLGMPLYQCQPPTGYKDTADAWVNAGALVNRMNQALALADGTLRGVRIAHAPAAEALVPSGVSEATRVTIAKAASVPQATALALGSPEFQRK